MIFTTLPEFIPPWHNASISTLTLLPLIDNPVLAMIAAISADLSVETVRRIVERADGMPLFVEEMTKIAALDNHARIPTTLHDMLTARMDNIGKAKYTAQLAATIGREFDLKLLRKISSYDASALTQSLSVLENAGLIMQLNESIYRFKHTLIQESAYQSQTKADRKTAHQRIAQVLFIDFPNIVATNQSF